MMARYYAEWEVLQDGKGEKADEPRVGLNGYRVYPWCDTQPKKGLSSPG